MSDTEPPATIDECAQIAHNLVLTTTGDPEVADIIRRGVEGAYRIGWNRSIAARPAPPASSDQATTLRWAAETLRGIPANATGLVGLPWYGAGWKDAADHLEDLADGAKEPSDA